MRPTVRGLEGGSHPRDTCSGLTVVDGAPTGRCRTSSAETRQLGVGDMERRHALGADPGQVAGVAAVVAPDDEHQVERLRSSRSARTASCRSWVALQMVSNARKWWGSAASPYRSVIAARSISPISSDSDMSMVVWLAQPIRSRSRSGSNPGETASPNRARKRGRAPARSDEVADDLRFLAIEHDEKAPLRVFQRLRRRRARFFVLDLAVDDRGISVLRVAHDVLPDVEHGPARRVDERAALVDEARHVTDGHAEGRQDHDVFRSERFPRFGRLAQEPDAGGAQPIVDVGIVDDLAGQVDVLLGKSPPRLIGVVDGAVDAVAESEFAGEVHGQTPDTVLEVVVRALPRRCRCGRRRPVLRPPPPSCRGPCGR